MREKFKPKNVINTLRYVGLDVAVFEKSISLDINSYLGKTPEERELKRRAYLKSMVHDFTNQYVTNKKAQIFDDRFRLFLNVNEIQEKTEPEKAKLARHSAGIIVEELTQTAANQYFAPQVRQIYRERKNRTLWEAVERSRTHGEEVNLTNLAAVQRQFSLDNPNPDILQMAISRFVNNSQEKTVPIYLSDDAPRITKTSTS